jgi:GNAT superfamily N-acetyltransferase
MIPAILSELEESNSQFSQAWRGFGVLMGSADLRDIPGLAISWPNASLAFYNVVYLSGPVASTGDFEDRARRAVEVMRTKAQPGMFVVCQDWLPADVSEGAAARLVALGLHPEMTMTGMAADELLPPVRELPQLEYRRVNSQETREAISDINSSAYDLPIELGRASMALERVWPEDCYGYAGYVGTRAVAASATFPIDGRLYVALVATLPEMRRRGYAEAVMRYSLQEAARGTGIRRMTLHATDAGRPLYLAMGYHDTARFTAYMLGD